MNGNTTRPFGAVAALAICLDIDGHEMTVGTLAWSRRVRRAVFEYHPAFLASGHNLSPYNLGLNPAAITAPSSPFEGLHGLFADSLPDGWGRHLTDRKLATLGIDHRSLTPVDRLSLVGTRGVGALTYRPDAFFDAPGHGLAQIGLDMLATQVRNIQGNGGDQSENARIELDRLQAMNGGSSGARPKIMAFASSSGALFTRGDARDPQWLIKFPAREDDPAIGAIEAAYAAMASEGGVAMAETHLFRSSNGDPAMPGYFGTRRFDRVEGARILIHSVAGLAHADHRIPSFSYESLLVMTRQMTLDQRQVEEQFRRAVFNVLASNRDDHTKNHAFLYNALARAWKLTPAYDLTPSAGMGGEHALTIAGKGTGITRADLLTLAAGARISTAPANAIIDKIAVSISRWPVHAAASGVPARAISATGHLLSARSLSPGPLKNQSTAMPMAIPHERTAKQQILKTMPTDIVD